MKALASKFGLWGSAGIMEALGKDIIPTGRWLYGFPNFDDAHAKNHLYRDNLKTVLNADFFPWDLRGSTYKETLLNIIKAMNQPTWADNVKIGFPPLSEVQAMMAQGDKNYQDDSSFGYTPSWFGHGSWGALGPSAWVDPTSYVKEGDPSGLASGARAPTERDIYRSLEQSKTKPVKKNAGGRIPGTGTSDTVPAMLTPGEFVVNAAASRANLGLLQSINTHGATQRFSEGGQAWPIRRFARGGVSRDERGLWRATGGAKLSRAQILENRVARINVVGTGRVASERTSPAIRRQRELERRREARSNVTSTSEERAEERAAKRAGMLAEAEKMPRGDLTNLLTPEEIALAGFMLETLRTRPMPPSLTVDHVKAFDPFVMPSSDENPFVDTTSGLKSSALERWSTSYYGQEWAPGAVDKWLGVNRKIFTGSGNITKVADAEHKALIEGQMSGPNLVVGQPVDLNKRLQSSWNLKLEEAFRQGKKKAEETAEDIRQYGTVSRPKVGPLDIKGPGTRGGQRVDSRAQQRESRSRSRRYYSTGGSVDSVPAMLTPGEFVVNAEAAQRNLGLLHAINNTPVQKFAKGGPVRRYRDGGREGRGGLFGGNRELATAITTFNATTPTLAAAMNNFKSSELAAAMNSLAASSSKLYDAAVKLADALSQMPNIPEQISGAFAASVNLSNEAGFGETLAKAMGRELGDTISGEVSKHTQKRNVDGTPSGPVTS